MRYRLRTLLVVLAILPPLLAVGWWKYSAWRAERKQQAAIELELKEINADLSRWLKAGAEVDPAEREAEILRLAGRAMVLNRAKAGITPIRRPWPRSADSD
jgi:hypothetical protein